MTPRNAQVLTVNGGSSSIQFALFAEAAFAVALGGLDTVRLAGVIGENSPVIRARICAGLEFLGIDIDPQRNGANAAATSVETSRVAVRVVRTDEERVVADTVFRLLAQEELL
jgi:acetate kinase